MKTKVLSIILAVAVLFGVMQTAVFAVDDENGMGVFFSATDDDVIMEPIMLWVEDGISEEYGYTVSETDHNNVPVEGITVLDTIVAAHAYYYGDLFTSATAEDYLVVNNGYLQKAFGKSAVASGFTIDGKVPHDDIETAYGYTGYAADTAVIEEEGSFVSFFFYQDTSYYTDILASFGTTTADVCPGESITFTLTGYSAAYYGCAKDETIEAMTEVLAGIDVYMKEANEETFTKIGTTNENGEITIEFEEEGSYTIYAAGETESECPVIIPFTLLYSYNEDIPEEPENPTICERIGNFFSCLCSTVSRIISYVYNLIVRLIDLF